MKPSNMYLRTRNEDDDHGEDQKKIIIVCSGWKLKKRKESFKNCKFETEKKQPVLFLIF